MKSYLVLKSDGRLETMVLSNVLSPQISFAGIAKGYWHIVDFRGTNLLALVDSYLHGATIPEIDRFIELWHITPDDCFHLAQLKEFDLTNVSGMWKAEPRSQIGVNGNRITGHSNHPFTAICAMFKLLVNQTMQTK